MPAAPPPRAARPRVCVGLAIGPAGLDHRSVGRAVDRLHAGRDVAAPRAWAGLPAASAAGARFGPVARRRRGEPLARRHPARRPRHGRRWRGSARPIPAPRPAAMIASSSSGDRRGMPVWPRRSAGVRLEQRGRARAERAVHVRLGPADAHRLAAIDPRAAPQSRARRRRRSRRPAGSRSAAACPPAGRAARAAPMRGHRARRMVRRRRPASSRPHRPPRSRPAPPAPPRSRPRRAPAPRPAAARRRTPPGRSPSRAGRRTARRRCRAPAVHRRGPSTIGPGRHAAAPRARPRPSAPSWL